MTEADKLREKKIYNDYTIANFGDLIFVTYAKNGGRSMFSSWFAVHYIGKKFIGSAWYEYGAKTFKAKNSRDYKVLLEALTFASKIINCNEWVKTPFGGYVSKYTADKVKFNYKEKNIIKIKGEEKNG